MARTSVGEEYAWFSPAGANRGAINNAIKLAYNHHKHKEIYSTLRESIQLLLLLVRASFSSVIRLLSDMHLHSIESMFVVCSSQWKQQSNPQQDPNSLEFNDEITRNNFVNIVEPYLRDVKGKITEFIVVCDDSNNTPDVIDSNQFKADIFVKPARSINFIGLTFVATRTGIELSEVVGNV